MRVLLRPDILTVTFSTPTGPTLDQSLESNGVQQLGEG